MENKLKHGNRKQSRALTSKIKKMSGAEVDLIIGQFMRDLYGMKLRYRLIFCFNLLIKKENKEKANVARHK